MKDYSKMLRNRFRNSKDIDKLITKLDNDSNFKIEKVDLRNNYNTDEIAKFYDLTEIKTYSIKQYETHENEQYKKAEITILYRNYNTEEMREIIDLYNREIEEMGASGVEIFKNEIVRIFY